MDAENLMYQRQQKQAEDQLRQFQIGSQIENQARDDRARGISEALKMGQFLPPEERGGFYTGGLAASAQNYNAPGIYNAEAMRGIGRPGWHLPQAAPNMQAPQAAQAPPLSPEARAALPGQVQDIRSQFDRGVTGPPAETYPSSPGQGASPGPSPPGRGAGVQQPGIMLPPAAPTPPPVPSPAQDLQQQIGQPIAPFGPQHDPTTAAMLSLQMAQPMAPKAGPYLGALQGQQQAMAGAQMGAAAAATGSGGAPGGGVPPTGAPGGGAIMPASTLSPGASPYGTLSGGAEAAVSALQAPPQPLVRGPGGSNFGLDPNDLHPAAQVAQAPGATFKPPWGGEYHISELNKGEGRDIAQKVAQAAKAAAQLDLSDPQALAWLRLAQADDLGREPRTRAEYEKAAQALREYQMASAGHGATVARLQFNEGQQERKDLLANGMNAQAYRDIHQQYLQRRAANPAAAGVDRLGDQREYPLMEAALKSRDEALQRGDNQAAEQYETEANDYADTIKASIAADKTPAQQARAFQIFNQRLAQAAPESLSPKDLKNMIHAAGLDEYFKDVPDQNLRGALFGARAEKMVQGFYANMPKLAHLTPEAQHAFTSNLNNLIDLLGPGGPAIHVPADVVLRLSPAEQIRFDQAQQRLAQGDRRLDYTGDNVAIRRAHEQIWRAKMRGLFGGPGGLPVSASVQLRGLEHEYNQKKELFNMAVKPDQFGQKPQEDLDDWDAAAIKANPASADPNRPGETLTPPPTAAGNPHSAAHAAWAARSRMNAARDASDKKLNDLIQQHGMPGAARPAGVQQQRQSQPAGLPKAVSNDNYSFNWARQQGRSEAFIMKAWQRGLLHP